MKLHQRLSVLALASSLTLSASAAIRYVNANSVAPAPPYTNWPSAAATIQDAVDAATPGDEIVVTNGVYTSGARVVGGVTNRVAVFKPLSVRSVNGPAATVIQGYQMPGTTNGNDAVRCVYLTNGAVFVGFTVTRGATALSSPGGGILCAGASVLVSNCVIIGNSAYLLGGGVYGGALYDCILANNSAVSGGGAHSSTLNRCRLLNNAADDSTGVGGGAAYSTLENCLLLANSASRGGGVCESTARNCTIVSNSAAASGGGEAEGWVYNSIVYYNTAPAQPNCTVDSFHISYTCTMPFSGNGANNITNAPLFVDPLSGDFHLKPASPCINAANNSDVGASTDLEGNPRLVAGAVDMGAYEFQAPLHYVDSHNSSPVSPYTNWATAATNIQDALNAASAGDCVLVTNGVYRGGGSVATGRIYLQPLMRVESVNGPEVTTISGGGVMRCALLSSNTTLKGFTLLGGKASSSGGGTFCLFGEAIVADCIFSNNTAVSAGGAYLCVLSNCTFVGNTATNYGGGAALGTLYQCSFRSNSAGAAGGGIFQANATNCTFAGNQAGSGGGAFLGYLYGCTFTGNSAASQGGGACGSTLINCTIAGNSAGSGGGVCDYDYAIGSLQLRNCIVFANTASSGSNWWGGTFNACCTAPAPTNGSGNIVDAPLFVDQAAGNLRLQSNSPCINAGNNASVPSNPDLDGNPRVAGGTVDIGAYEFQAPASVISYAWLQQYGLPTDGTADGIDTDDDQMNSWQEWRAQTDPTNALSVLRMLTLSNDVSSLTVTWQSMSGVNYFLERSGDLGAPPAFSTIQSNLVGQAGSTTFTDTNAIGSGPLFYRVGVQ
jgi:hypothetical protein